MARTAFQYKELIKSLLPKGRAWTRDADSIFDQYCYALGEEFARIESRQGDLNLECHVTLATELLSEHEEDYGLVDGSAYSTAERRAILHAQLLSVGGLYPNYYIDLIAALGYTISITEYTPAWAGVATCGSACGSQEIIFLFTVNVFVDGDEGQFFVREFDSGFAIKEPNDITVYQSRVRSLDGVIEVLRPLKPAHMRDLYDFYEPALDRGFSWAFDSFPTNDDSIPIPQYGWDFSTAFAAQHEYDGTYLIGAFDQAFNLSCDAHFGGGFQEDEYSSDFWRPA